MDKLLISGGRALRGEVRISGETRAYVWGDRMIGIHHCPVCGCGTHWETLGEDFGRMGVNARLLDGFDESAIEGGALDFYYNVLNVIGSRLRAMPNPAAEYYLGTLP